MTDYIATSTDLTTVADAIRTKGGTSAPLTFPNGFVSAINSIPTGGGGGAVEEKQINFIDYDGTIVDSYTAVEWASVSTLPANPSHTGLTAQGWNWTKAQIDAQLTAMPSAPIWVGQMYITESGDTEIDVSFADSTRLSPILTIAVNGTVTVDWGDNTTPTTVTGTSISTRQAPTHTYTAVGDYTIKISVTTGSFRFYANSSNSILRKNTTQYENRQYANCIKAIRIGAYYESPGDYEFSYCSSLKSITIPSGVTSNRDSLFYYCYSLASVTLPSSITTIGVSWFNCCYSIKNISLPSGVTTIGNTAFNGCYSLEGTTIPSGVTTIGNGIFQACYALKYAAIPNTVTSIGTSLLYSCAALASLTIPSGITTISNSMINGCAALASITIPSSVTTIGNSAFTACYALASITIPSDVTSIGNSAFSNCYGIAEYHIKPTTPPTLGTTAFNNIPSDCKIYVPAASLTAYQTATNWSTYASYMVGE